MSTGRRPRLVEVSLVALTLAVVFGMGRLFEDDGWVAPLVLNALAAHLAVAWFRRRELSLAVAGALTAVAGVLCVTWTSYLSTTVIGLPTSRTWSTMGADLGDAWTLYRDVVAPAPVEPGFVLASAIALWIVAYLADWAAFRLWVPFEATLPAGTLFLFTALLGEPDGRTTAVAAYAGAVLSFLLVHRLTGQDGSSHWVAGRQDEGYRSLLLAGAGLAVVAVLAGSVLGPSVPGAGSPGLLDPRALRGGSARVTISPLVDIRSRLVSQAGLEVFAVRSPVRSYWRLTSLDSFDGRIWSSSGSFGKAGGSLPQSIPPDIATETFEQSFSISALSAIWLPAAYEPRSVAGAGAVGVRYDDESATLIVDDDEPTSDGLTYRVTSASPRLEDVDLRGPTGVIPTGIIDRYTDLPPTFSVRVRDLAKALTRRAATPAEQARALQDYLRTFEYSLQVQPGHSVSALEDFLFTTKVGYCEQFAGAFAAMARSLGLPTRVAVGFTPGDEDPKQPGLFHVRGEYAHAWPEVYLAGVGWVPFEPTPGRGIPNAEGYTGVPDQQAAAGSPDGSVVVPTTAPGGTLPSLPTGSTPDAPSDVRSGDDAGGRTAAGADRPLTRRFADRVVRVAPAVGGVVLAYILLFPLGMLAWRHLRRRRATTPAAQIDLAWRESVESARLLGFQERPSDTYVERANLLARALPDSEGALVALAHRLETAAYSAAGAGDDDAEAAWEAAGEIRGAARRRVPRPARMREWFDPRTLVRGWRDGLGAGHRRITLTARGDLEQERELVGSGDRR